VASNENKIDFVLDLDDSQFAKTVVGAIEKIEGLGAAAGSVAAAAGVMTAAFLAVKTSLDLTFEAEQIRAIGNQFEILARQAGIAGDALKDGLVHASGGLIDDTDLMQMANKAIIDLGKSAERLPQIMDIARRVSMVTGQSIAETFQTIEQAVTSGQTKQLKALGIIVDSEKAYRDYARSLGIAENALSEAGKRQAIFNQVLEQGSQKYKDVQVDVKEATNTWQVLKVTLSQIGEVATLAYERMAGEKVRSALSFVRDWAIGAKTWFTAHFGEGVEAAGAKTDLLKDKIKNLQVQIIDVEQSKLRTKDVFRQAQYTAEIVQLQDQLKMLQAELAKTEEAKKKLEPAQIVGPPKPTAEQSAQSSPVDKEQLKKNEAQFQKDLVALHREAMDQRRQLMTDQAMAEAVYQDQIVQIHKQTQARLAELEASHSLNPAQKAQERQQILENETRAIELAEQQRLQIKQQAIDNLSRKNWDSAQGFANAWKAGSQSAALQLSNWNASGTRVLKSFEGNATNALQAFGAGQKSASEAAKGFIFGMLADEAEARGKLMMLASIFPFNPAGMAAGMGLIALSGFLRSQGGGSSGGGGGGGSVSGGGDGGSASLTTDSGQPAVSEKAQNKAVTIQVMGNYFETEQTKTRLVEMIREASDATDFTIKGGI
jgi:hypothetical protein